MFTCTDKSYKLYSKQNKQDTKGEALKGSGSEELFLNSCKVPVWGQENGIEW
jgi:hypothetical protein